MQIAGCSGCRLAMKIEPTAGLAMYDPGEPRCQFVLQVEGDRPNGGTSDDHGLLAPPGGGPPLQTSPTRGGHETGRTRRARTGRSGVAIRNPGHLRSLRVLAR